MSADACKSIRMELDAAFTALATAVHALDMAGVLAAQGGDNVLRHRIVGTAHEVHFATQQVKRHIEELDR